MSIKLNALNGNEKSVVDKSIRWGFSPISIDNSKQIYQIKSS